MPNFFQFDNRKKTFVTLFVLGSLAGLCGGFLWDAFGPPSTLSASTAHPVGRSAGFLDSLRHNRTLQTAARSLLIGKYYDRSVIAQRRGDEADYEKAQRKLQTLAPGLADKQGLSKAELLVTDASELDMRAYKEKDPKKAKSFSDAATKKYRAALKLAPDFDSSNPNLLNALGYFLADRGTSQADFKTAEKLVRRSLKIIDEAIAQMQQSIVPGTGRILAAQKFGRANVADSLAWALYRQKRYAEALKEQRAAVAQAKEYAPKFGETVPTELIDHLRAIEKTAGKNADDGTPKAEQSVPDVPFKSNDDEPQQLAMNFGATLID